MNSLDQAVEAIAGRPEGRADAVAELEGMVRDCELAIGVWQHCLDTPGTGNHWTIVSWLGGERVQQLHELNLSARDRVRRLGDLAGLPASGVEEHVIETAFGQAAPGQVGPDAARAAIERMRGRIAHVRVLLQRLGIPATRRSKAKGPKKAARAGRRPVAAARRTTKGKKAQNPKKTKKRKAAKKKK